MNAKNLDTENSENKSSDIVSSNRSRQNRVIDKLIQVIENNEYLNNEQIDRWSSYFDSLRSIKRVKSRNILRCYIGKDTYINLTGDDFRSLADYSKFLNDKIVDALVGSACNSYDVNYIQTAFLKLMESDSFTRSNPSPFEKGKDHYLAVYNASNDHWVLLVFDRPARKLHVIDPLTNGVRRDLGERVLRRCAQIHHGKGSGARMRRVEENNDCEVTREFERMSLNSEWNFVDERWQVGGIPHTLQTDRHNCGVFCIQFALQIVHELDVSAGVPDSLVVRADLDELRRRYVATILNISDQVEK